MLVGLVGFGVSKVVVEWSWLLVGFGFSKVIVEWSWLLVGLRWFWFL